MFDVKFVEFNDDGSMKNAFGTYKKDKIEVFSKDSDEAFVHRLEQFDCQDVYNLDSSGGSLGFDADSDQAFLGLHRDSILFISHIYYWASLELDYCGG